MISEANMTNNNENNFDKVYSTARVQTITESPFELELFSTKEDGSPLEVIAENVSLTEIVMLRQFKLIQELDNKITNGRIKDKESEKLKIQYYKLYLDAVNMFMKIANGMNTNYDKKIMENFLHTDFEDV